MIVALSERLEVVQPFTTDYELLRAPSVESPALRRR